MLNKYKIVEVHPTDSYLDSNIVGNYVEVVNKYPRQNVPGFFVGDAKFLTGRFAGRAAFFYAVKLRKIKRTPTILDKVVAYFKR